MQLSKFLRLNERDFWNGLYIALATAILGSLGEMISGHGLDFASYNWAGILDLAWKVTGVYLTKNLLQDANGNPLGLAQLKKLGGYVGLPKK